MRLRLSRLFEELHLDERVKVSTFELMLGASVPYQNGYLSWRRFFETSSITDLLDSITVIADIVRTTAYRNSLRQWLEYAEKIFREENVRYRIDENGIVHFAIDHEFERNQASALAALQHSRYGAARAHYEAGQKALDASPPETREAIRQTFECAETLFKLMFPNVSGLGSTEVAKKLNPLVESWPAGTERDASLRLITALKGWVDSAQPYRHGQSVEEPDNPSLSTAVLSVSLGSSFIRWFAELDTEAQSESAE